MGTALFYKNRLRTSKIRSLIYLSDQTSLGKKNVKSKSALCSNELAHTRANFHLAQVIKPWATWNNGNQKESLRLKQIRKNRKSELGRLKTDPVIASWGEGTVRPKWMQRTLQRKHKCALLFGFPYLATIEPWMIPIGWAKSRMHLKSTVIDRYNHAWRCSSHHQCNTTRLRSR